MEKFFRMLFIGGIALFALLASFQSLTVTKQEATAIKLPKAARTPLDPVIKGPATDINNQMIRDNDDIYQYDVPGSVVTLYVTVRKGNDPEKTDSTWAELNDLTGWLYSEQGSPQNARAEAIVQFGDENGPLPGEVGYSDVVPNATIQLRGASASMIPQRSYHIDLNQGAGKWRGQSTLALNKHISDPSRVRNKINFDLLKGIPNMVSMRTQFVHLYIRDQTVNPWEKTFVDYGLYTQVELPNKQFLKNHLLDANGQLYKAIDFRFDRYPDQLRLVDDPLFDEATFASRLELKGNKDNSKLLQMLDNLNNLNVPIETTFEKYFSPENYFTWMAYNILVGNVDTASQNFYLYSPRNSNTFYFLPWDYDNSFSRLERSACCEPSAYFSYQYGVANYWGTSLANRVLRVPAYREILDAKIKEVKEQLTAERIKGLLGEYQPLIQKYALQMPDVQYLPTTTRGVEQDFEVIPSEVENNYELYLESLKTPLPFYLGTPLAENGMLKFQWGESYDFDGEAITYHFSIARDPGLQDVVFTKMVTGSTSVLIEPLEPGEYYWSVSAVNASGKTQLPFDHLYDVNGIPRSGLKRFSILPDGQVEENEIKK